MDPPSGFIIYTIGAFKSRLRGSMFWILAGLWVAEAPDFLVRTLRPAWPACTFMILSRGESGCHKTSCELERTCGAGMVGMTLRRLHGPSTILEL